MIISDVLYGEFEVDAVLEELILSKPMQKTKGNSSSRRKLLNEREMECNSF